MVVRTTGGKGSTDIEGLGNQATGALSHVEGLGNIASGSYAHVEGNASTASGISAHAEGYSCTASGNYSHAEGYACTASGHYSHAENSSSTASGTYSHCEGDSGVASADAAHCEGEACIASGYYSHAEGEFAVAARRSQHAKASGRFAAAGDAQFNMFVARSATADASPTLTTFSGSAVATLTGAGANVLTIPASRAHRFRIDVIARNTAADEAAGWEFRGVINRHSTGNARFVGTVEQTAWGDAAAATWDVTLAIDVSNATNNYLTITVTGEAAKAIRWVTTLYSTEVG